MQQSINNKMTLLILRLKSLFVLTTVLLCSYQQATFAQAVQPNTKGLNSLDFALPDFTPDPQQAGTILPLLKIAQPADTEEQSLYQDQGFVLQSVEFSGNTVIATEVLEKIFVPYFNKNIQLSNLQNLRDQVTQTYIKQGYINSGAILPDQTIQQGKVKLHIIEGQLSEIRVKTSGRFAKDYFSKRLALAAKPAVNINRLQEKLYLLQQDTRIKKINAEFKPGQQVGRSIFDIDVVENSAINTQIELNNHHAPAIGAEGARINWQHNNLWGHAEELVIGFEKTEGLSSINIDYSWPINLHDDELAFFAAASDSDVITGEFESLDIESRSQTFGVRYQSPIQHKRNKKIDWFVSAEVRKSESLLLGEGFSFSAGPEDGVSKLTVLRGGLDWQNRSATRVLAARATLNVGLDALSATINDNELPDGEFISMLMQSQWAQRLPLWESILIAKLDLQWSNESLLGLEQFVVGGQASVRGYRENSLVRDQGAVVSVEWQIPYYVSQGRANHKLALFYDAGTTDNIDRETLGLKSISSLGLGLVGQFTPQLYYQFYLADALEDTMPLGESDLQDDGIHFKMAYQF